MENAPPKFVFMREKQRNDSNRVDLADIRSI